MTDTPLMPAAGYLCRTLARSMLAALVAVSALLAAPLPAAAVLEPIPIASDPRIRVLPYQADEIYKYTGFYGYQSVIEFERGEQIGTISMGDSTAWQITPAAHRLFLKPVGQDAVTNMLIITSKRHYLFELHAEETEEIADPRVGWITRFIYSGTADMSGGMGLDPVPDPLMEPDKYNFNYTISGTDKIAPLKIFDDGEFTYFEFRNINADIPAIFLVEQDGSESLINYRTRRPYIVVERVSARFTLRYGDEVVCVYNEKIPFMKKEKPRSFWSFLPWVD